MDLSMRVYLTFHRAIGLGSLYYDAQRKRFLLRHSRSQVYCLLLDVAYLVVMPYVVSLLVDTFYRCEVLDMFAIVFNVTALAKMLAVVLLLLGAWFRRRPIQFIANGLQSLLERYWQRLDADCTQMSLLRRRCLWMMSLISARFVVLALQLFGQGSAIHCVARGVAEPSPFYVTSALFLLLMELMISCADFSIYMAAACSNTLLAMMRQEAQELVQDSQALRQKRFSYHVIWERQLLVAWCGLWQRCLRLSAIMEVIVQSFQWQLLIDLFNSYVSGIAIFFRLMVYASDGSAFKLSKFFVYVFLCISTFAEIMLRFFIFDINRRHWEYLEHHFVQFWLHLPEVDKSAPGTVLSRRLEFSVLMLGRNLQTQPQRIRRLQIAGLFDMSMETGFSMYSSMFMNVIILCQIALKKYIEDG
ncbi:putative gustatory receptor 58c [Scaptodrosophila lebanonensis]|uniref:Gustatory receptor n=1 Tax=Drosophila lebanonensis TaxID=7225 RepID=A0A6J2TKD6_DROLE|nr:putative gustatory receptor 58c [Scaptodrosophila lebanonensis]